MTDDYLAFLERRRSHLRDTIRFLLIPSLAECAWILFLVLLVKILQFFHIL